MECMNCHEMNEEGNKFCNNCGTELVKEEVTNTQVEEPKTVEAPVTPAAPIVTSNTSKKSSNVALIIIISVVSFLLVGALTFFGVKSFLDGQNSNGGTKNNTTNNTKNNIVNNNTTNNNTKNNTKTTTEEKTQVVGADKYGYVTIPSDWVKFTDPDVTIDLVQYSTLSSDYVLTMMYYSKSEVVSAEQAATNVSNHMSTENVTGLTGAKVKVAGYDAYQVYGYYPDENEWLVCWFFEAEDGYIHYIAVEGPSRYSDHFKIPDTFKLNKNTL